MPGLVLYASRYGSTAEYAVALARALNARCTDVVTAGEAQLSVADWLVLGSPIYGPGILQAMTDFIAEHRPFIEEKAIGAFVVCGDQLWSPRSGQGGSRNLRKLTAQLPALLPATAVFGGRMRMEDLNPTDRETILDFYRKLGREATGFDRTDLETVRPFARDVRMILASGGPKAKKT